MSHSSSSGRGFIFRGRHQAVFPGCSSPRHSRPLGYGRVLFLCFVHSRCCRSTGFANRRWALLLLTRRPLRVFVRRSLLTPDGPCLSVWVQSLACGVFVRRALRTPDGPFLSVWVQNLAGGVCVCVILGVSVCVSFSVWLCCVCVVLCVGVSRLCFAAPGALAARPTWQLGRRGNGDAVAQAKERGWDASKAMCSQLT